MRNERSPALFRRTYERTTQIQKCPYQEYQDGDALVVIRTNLFIRLVYADMNTRFSRHVGVIGGCGHVGLPLALIFAESGLRTLIFDINQEAVEQVRGGVMPFREESAQPLLEQSLANGLLEVTTNPAPLQECEYLVLIVGTPVDEHLSPAFHAIER